MKKPLKTTLLIACCAAPIAFLISFVTPWIKDVPISVVGSSGVKPFTEALGADYQKSNDDIDITVDAGGSGFGIEQVAKGFTSIGNASKDPYHAVRGTDKANHRKEWEENRIKTITIGWEAICVIYVPPTGLSNNSPDYLNLALKVSSTSISMFYQSFSGWFWKNDIGLQSKPTLEKFINEDKVSKEDQKLFKNTYITPYVRTGGGHTSGTASSFFDKSHFDLKNRLSEEQVAAFTDGAYGHDFDYVETDEANSRAYSLFRSNNIGSKRKSGSMVYLSSAFVESNKEEIEKNGYGIMAYQADNKATAKYSVDNVQNGTYSWFRPLNSMVPLPENPIEQPTASMKFLSWILFGKSEKPWDLQTADDHNGLYKKIGGIPLGKNQFMSMLLEKTETKEFWKNFWVSDYKLAGEKWLDDGSFGAKE